MKKNSKNSKDSKLTTACSIIMTLCAVASVIVSILALKKSKETAAIVEREIVNVKQSIASGNGSQGMGHGLFQITGQGKIGEAHISSNSVNTYYGK